MKDKFPEIYKNRVDKLKSKVQKEFYYHNDDNSLKKEDRVDKKDREGVDKMTL